MKDDMTNNLPTAHFANEFALKGKTDFSTPLEWLIFLFGVAQIDPMSEGKIPPIYVPVLNIKKALKNTSGDFNRQLRSIIIRMAKAVCIFENDTYIDGYPMPKVLTMFSETGIEKREDGKLFLKLEISEKTTPIVKGFSRNFFGIKPPVGMKSAHAINFLIYAKAYRDSRRKHEKVTVISFTIEDFKQRMNVAGKYSQIKDLKKYVIQPIITGVNKSGILRVGKTEYEKTGRRITKVLFFIEDEIQTKALLQKADSSGNTSPTEEETQALTYAQLQAYNYLVDKGIYSGIAIRKIIPKMPSSICDGYEDYFCEEVYKIVVEKSKVKDAKGRAAILVDWFKKDIFKDDYFSRIIENVHKRKKQLTGLVKINREAAKGMTHEAFVRWQKEQKDKNIDLENDSEGDSNFAKGLESVGDIMKTNKLKSKSKEA